MSPIGLNPLPAYCSWWAYYRTSADLGCNPSGDGVVYSLRILRCGEQISYTRAPLARYRVREGSLTHRQLEYMEQALRVLDKAERTLIRTPEERDALERRRETVRFRINILRGKEAIKHKDWATARRHFKLCLEQQPTAKLKAALLLLRACPLVLTALIRLRRF